MNALFAAAGTEFRIALRNRWVTVAVAMMALFALVLSAAGSAATGALGADRLSVTVASLTSLAVYLVPLIALLMSFDAIAGEVERGTLPLVLTYPVARATLLAGKFAAHLGILALAVAVSGHRLRDLGLGAQAGGGGGGGDRAVAGGDRAF
jgi:Cu-processing system permease protein